MPAGCRKPLGWVGNRAPIAFVVQFRIDGTRIEPRSGELRLVKTGLLPRVSWFRSVSVHALRGQHGAHCGRQALRTAFAGRARQAGKCASLAPAQSWHRLDRHYQTFRGPLASPCVARVRSGVSGGVYGRGVPDWVGSVATVASTLVAIAALIASIWAVRRVARGREFEILLERIDREATKRETETRTFTERVDLEAAKREAETRAFTERIEREAAKREEQFEREVAKREESIRVLMDRSDKRFDALLMRSDELQRQLAGVAVRVAQNEAVSSTAQATRHDAPAKSAPATTPTEAVAAQGLPSGRSEE